MNIRRFAIAAALLGAAGSALAHGGHVENSFFTGFGHPLGGLDHLLAMLAVGLYAARHGGPARWLLPLSFVTAMLGGAAMGVAGFALPMVEAGIAASVLVFGVLIAVLAKLPLGASIPLVAVFALFHGHAHGAEIGSATLLSFAAGFALATAALHGVGLLIGRWLPESGIGSAIKRAAGVLITGTGVVLLGS